MDPLTIGAIIGGVKVGTELLGMDPASRALKRERDVLRRQRRRASRFAQQQGVMGMLGDIREQARTIPMAARRRFEGQLASFAQQEQSRIGEALAQAGITGASESAARQRRQLGGDIEQRRLAGEQQLAQLQNQMTQGALGATGNVMSMLFPGAGQQFQAQMGSVGQYVDPTQGIMGLLGLAGLSGGGGGGGGFGRSDLLSLQNQLTTRGY